MRHAIETAPIDGTIVILEDGASATLDVAHWSPEAGKWVDKNGEPSKIEPTHWYPLPRDKYLLQENDGTRSPSRVGQRRIRVGDLRLPRSRQPSLPRCWSACISAPRSRPM